MLEAAAPPPDRRTRMARFPYWLIAALVLGIAFLWIMLTRPDYRVILEATLKGVRTTLYVTVVAYALALIAGLVIALMRVSASRTAREVSSFYVEIVRAVPMLVILYYIAFVGAPALATGLSGLGTKLQELGVPAALAGPLAGVQTRSLSFTTRAIMALTIGYSAFIAEILRAGIESIPRGQMEAARSLGMSYAQAMRHIILPQATRNVLPPLGNDFIAMLKDSSLVSVLGVQDITQIGKVYAASTFRFFETYNVVAFLYLVLVVGLALFVRWLEMRMPRRG
jgi:polar amino acid transport system permease protein